jgi:hypothetical protein
MKEENIKDSVAKMNTDFRLLLLFEKSNNEEEEEEEEEGRVFSKMKTYKEKRRKINLSYFFE